MTLRHRWSASSIYGVGCRMSLPMNDPFPPKRLCKALTLACQIKTQVCRPHRMLIILVQTHQRMIITCISVLSHPGNVVPDDSLGSVWKACCLLRTDAKQDLSKFKRHKFVLAAHIETPAMPGARRS
jgi:hypothetical protein